jgi:hypothetical protein
MSVSIEPPEYESDWSSEESDNDEDIEVAEERLFTFADMMRLQAMADVRALMLLIIVLLTSFFL